MVEESENKGISIARKQKQANVMNEPGTWKIGNCKMKKRNVCFSDMENLISNLFIFCPLVLLNNDLSV